jgi:hypothetical protein
MSEQLSTAEKLFEKPIDDITKTSWGDLTELYNEDGQRAVEDGLVAVERDVNGKITKAVITLLGQESLRDRAILEEKDRLAIKESKQGNIDTIMHKKRSKV